MDSPESRDRPQSKRRGLQRTSHVSTDENGGHIETDNHHNNINGQSHNTTLSNEYSQHQNSTNGSDLNNIPIYENGNYSNCTSTTNIDDITVSYMNGDVTFRNEMDNTTTPAPFKEYTISASVRKKNQHDASNSHSSSTNRRYKYGWCGLNPGCLQWLNTAAWFMIVMGAGNFFQSGTTNGLQGAMQSSIEKRFQLTSTQSSMIILGYELATIPLVVFVAYKGTVGCHRPRWTSILLLVSCCGCFLYSIPHFTTPVYQPSVNSSEDKLCHVTSYYSNNNNSNSSILSGNCFSKDENSRNGTESEAESNGSLQKYLALFIFSRICLGFGGTGLNNFALTYLDDCLTRDKFALYSSIFALGGILGPAVAFIVAGFVLRIYTDFTSPDASTQIDFAENDPRWVGAWWLGYIVAGVGCFLTLLPMTGFPSDLPGAAEVRAKKVNEASGTSHDPSLTNLFVDFKIKYSLRFAKDLFTNLSWLFVVLFVCCDALIMAGFGSFGPKYLQVQFSMTSGQASMIFGGLVVPAGCIGAITGGMVIKQLKLSYTGILKTEFCVCMVGSLLTCMFLVSCKQLQFAGVNINYSTNMSLTNYDLVSECNSHCFCENKFEPICSHENIQYLSPCYAGCLETHDTQGGKFFHNCSCIQSISRRRTTTSPAATTQPSLASDVNSSLDTPAAETSKNIHQAKHGICSNPSCKGSVAIFGTMLFLAMVALFLCMSFNISTIIRVVPNSHRLFSLMCASFIVRLLGSIPGPVLYGNAFDSACLLWQQDCEGKHGNCYHYDNRKLGYYIFAICASLKLVSAVFVFLAWRLYKPPPSILIETIVSKEVVENYANTAQTIVGDNRVIQNGYDINNSSIIESDTASEDNVKLAIEEMRNGDAIHESRQDVKNINDGNSRGDKTSELEKPGNKDNPYTNSGNVSSVDNTNGTLNENGPPKRNNIKFDFGTTVDENGDMMTQL